MRQLRTYLINPERPRPWRFWFMAWRGEPAVVMLHDRAATKPWDKIARSQRVAPLARTLGTVLRSTPCRHTFRAVTRLALDYEIGSSKLARLFVVSIVAGLLVAGCGNKGKLYLPDESDPSQQK